MRGLLALALLLLPLAAAAPTQVHLGLVDEDPARTLAVTWVEEAPVAEPAVVLIDGDEQRVVPAEGVTGPSPWFVYEARLTDLEPDTAYAYRIGGREFSFRTPPEDVETFTFAALGDMGVTDASAKNARLLEELAPSLVLHAGDVSYGEGNALVWQEWFGMVEPVASRAPWVPAIGNHEARVAGSVTVPALDPREQAFYRQHFALPGNEFWFSFDYGDVHFVALDTFTEVGISAEQVAWLDQDLAATSAHWTVVYLHEPPYSTNSHGSSERVQDAFVALFEEHDVDLVLAAHDHGYERSFPLRGGEPTLGPLDTYLDDAPVYVVTGGGGESLYEGWTTQPEWSAFRAAEYHVTEVTVSAGALDVRAVRADGSTLDAFRISRDGIPAGAVPGATLDDRAVGAPSLAIVVGALVVVALARRFSV